VDVRIALTPVGRGHFLICLLDDKGDTIVRHKAGLEAVEHREKAAKALCRELAGRGVEMTPVEMGPMLRDAYDAYVREKEAVMARMAAATATAPPEDDSPFAEERKILTKTPPEVKEAAMAMLRDPELINRILDDIATIGVSGEEHLAMIVYMVGTSRKLADPLSLIVKGPTASGKSYVPSKTGTLMPPESVVRATQLTPQALYHMPPGSLRNKLVLAGERSRIANDDKAEATRALREMLSEKVLRKAMPVKVGNAMITVIIEQEGPISLIESTTLEDVFGEDENRCITAYTDEREEQTKRVIAQIARQRAGKVSLASVEEIKGRHLAAQRLLEPLDVVVPFGEQLSPKFPTKAVEARRAFGHLTSLVQASALLHQYQRERDGEGRIIADELDYEVARELLQDSMRRSLIGGLSNGAIRFFGRLQEWFGSRVFTTTEARKMETSSKRAVTDWLEALHNAGFVERVEESRGSHPAKWSLLTADTDRASKILPEWDEFMTDSNDEAPVRG
jgi:hypothetical protein